MRAAASHRRIAATAGRLHLRQSQHAAPLQCCKCPRTAEFGLLLPWKGPRNVFSVRSRGRTVNAEVHRRDAETQRKVRFRFAMFDFSLLSGRAGGAPREPTFLRVSASTRWKLRSYWM